MTTTRTDDYITDEQIHSMIAQECDADAHGGIEDLGVRALSGDQAARREIARIRNRIAR